MTEKATSPAIMRSMLGRARGLGSARSGLHHWWAQRLTAFALVPLVLWFIYSAIRLSGMKRGDVINWAVDPVVGTLLVALVLALFHHMRLGLQVVIEDYIHHERPRMVWLLVMKGVTGLLGLAALVAVIKLAI